MAKSVDQTLSVPCKKKVSVRQRRKQLDDLWAEVIKRLAYDSCEYCGGTQRLNSHHIYSRNNLAVRWDVSNGVCLCAKHHKLDIFSAHSAPLEMLEFLKQKRGKEWYETLRVKAKQTVKLSDDQRMNIYKRLKEMLDNDELLQEERLKNLEEPRLLTALNMANPDAS